MKQHFLLGLCVILFGPLVKGSGPSAGAPWLAKICRPSSNAIISSGNSMTVTFHTDSSKTATGFRLQYTAVVARQQNISVCGRSNITAFILQQNFISSPGYPSNYEHNLDCKWKIVAPTGTHVNVEVMSLALTSSSFCANDYLLFLDGHSSNAPTLVKICKPGLSVIVSSSNYMTITFHTDSSGTDRGFSLQYTAVPDIENLSATTLRANYLTSPGYPLNYRSVSSSDCQWRISAPIGTFVKVEVMFLSTSSSSLCIYDYLLFIDGSSTDSTRLAKLCRPTSRYIISTSNYMTITFHTDGLERIRTFRLKYTAVSQSCGSTLSASSIIPKNLTSPGYPSNYPNNIDCQWTLRAPIGRNVKVDVLFLAMESSRSCSNDYLMFNDGTSSNARRLKRICHKISDSIISSGRYLTISFHTDINLWDKGFRLLYTAGTFGPHRSIVVNYYETSYVQSPNFPLNYPINAEQTWTISTNSDGYVISLETRYFNIQYDDSCMFDFVQLYDGSDASAVSLGRWCGTRGPIKESSGASMFVKFQSDNLQSYGGFKFAFSAKKPSKNGQATNVGGIVGGVLGAITLVVILICCCASYNRKKSQSIRNRNVVNNGSYPNSIYSISPPGHLGHASTQRVMYTPSLTYPTTQSVMYTPPRAVPHSQPTVYTPPPAYNDVVTDAPPLYSDAIKLQDTQPVINTFTNDPSAYQVVDNPSCHL